MVSKSLRWLYVLSLGLAAAHQVEAVHSGEWGLMGIPVGAQGFVLITLVVFLFFAHGLVELAQGRRAGLWYAGVLAGGGLVTTGCHLWFLARGDGGFTHPVALVVLAGVGTASLALLLVTVRELPGPREHPEMPEPEFMER